MRATGRRHRPGIWGPLLDAILGREQLLLRAGEPYPIAVVSYRRGRLERARLLEDAFAVQLRLLSRSIVAPYDAVWPNLPALVLVYLRDRNVCGCLGHHHPAGSESRLARRLASDAGGPVGEIDLAFDAIAEWQPEPLAALATGAEASLLARIHVRAALLAVLLHELEHLAFPDRPEREVRLRSNAFYSAAMAAWVNEELGTVYGVASPPLP